MSRFSLISLIVVGLLLVMFVGLAFVDTHVQPVTVEKAMLNEASAK